MLDKYTLNKWMDKEVHYNLPAYISTLKKKNIMDVGWTNATVGPMQYFSAPGHHPDQNSLHLFNLYCMATTINIRNLKEINQSRSCPQSAHSLVQ